ncbi:MAG: efflux RND transporter periplasmic adaptor subunit [Actinobacteria bacterium]|nr:efflux RND transporter periplasmic adaptor subunit [Actinomycetota bacterium]
MTTDDTGFPVDSPDAPTKPKRRMTWKKWLAIGVAGFVVLAGAGVGTFLLLRPSNTMPTTFSRDVQATKGTQTQTVTFDGTLSPRKESDVNYSVSGTVTKVYVKAGDKVSKGQKLARIDDDDLQNAVDLAEANLTTARANYTEVVDNDGSSAAITSASAQVRSAKAALTSAKEDLKDAVLRAPIAGTVASVGIEVGDTVGSSSSGSSSASTTSSTTSTSSAEVVIIGTATWKVEGTVGASDLASVKAGQAVSVTTDASTDALKGTVTSVGIVSTATSSDGTATFPVVVKLSGKHTDLFSGTTATAVITTGSYPDVITVPTAAITTSDGKTVVTKVTNNQASTVEVTIGKVFGSYTQITDGVSESDTVRITITRPTGTSTSSDGGGISFGGGGFGGGFGGGAPPGGGAAPGGTGNGGNR